MSKKSPKARVPVKRRLPLVPPQKEPLLPARPLAPTEADNPYVSQTVAHIRRVWAISQIPPFTVLNDWSGMLEAALRFYAANARAYALTGRFINDPRPSRPSFARPGTAISRPPQPTRPLTGKCKSPSPRPSPG